eukprot:gene24438-biopygen17919
MPAPVSCSPCCHWLGHSERAVDHSGRTKNVFPVSPGAKALPQKSVGCLSAVSLCSTKMPMSGLGSTQQPPGQTAWLAWDGFPGESRGQTGRRPESVRWITLLFAAGGIFSRFQTNSTQRSIAMVSGFCCEVGAIAPGAGAIANSRGGRPRNGVPLQTTTFAGPGGGCPYRLLPPPLVKSGPTRQSRRRRRHGKGAAGGLAALKAPQLVPKAPQRLLAEMVPVSWIDVVSVSPPDHQSPLEPSTRTVVGALPEPPTSRWFMWRQKLNYRLQSLVQIVGLEPVVSSTIHQSLDSTRSSTAQ